MDDVTRILSAIERGDEQAAGQLRPLVDDELRKLATQRLAQEKPGQTLQPTALVREAAGALGARTTDSGGDQDGLESSGSAQLSPAEEDHHPQLRAEDERQRRMEDDPRRGEEHHQADRLA